MKNHLKLIVTLLNELKSKNLIKSIDKLNYAFYDEPKIYFYSAIINDKQNTFKAKGYEVSAENAISGGSGISFISRYEALLKCLSECAERFCNLRFNRNDIQISSYSNLHGNILDPTLYTIDHTVREKKFGWVEGFDIIANTYCYIPAQLVYVGYPLNNEVKLTSSISTGAAGGFDHETTLLRGIYEVVERDAYMTQYLNKIPAKRIDIEKIRNLNVQKMLSKCIRYNLQLFLFDVTNDLKIPTFLTVVIDKSGIGPAVVAGLKSSLNIKDAIIGSLEESLLCRFWLRYEAFKKKYNIHTIKPNKITNALQRGLFWYPIRMIKRLDFLLNQNPIPYQISSTSFTTEEELFKLRNIFFKKNLRIFYKDITLENFRKLGYLVYKVIIPELQPLYINEVEKEIRKGRLRSVSQYFGQNRVSINKIPHFFL